MKAKQISLTGLKPTGDLHLGSLIGAIEEVKRLEKEFDSFIFIADLHAITVPNKPEDLKRRSKEFLATYLACGLDPSKHTIYLQSDIDLIPAIGWVFECSQPYGELTRMTQFKDKSAKRESFSAGLLTYPVLQAADILAVDAAYVPVGADQKQHIELARNIADRFKGVFKKPQPLINTVSAKIYDLQEPTRKMDKTNENKKGVIQLTLDSEAEVRKKIMSAVTDSEAVVKFNRETKPGVSNLMTIYSALKDITIKDVEKEFKGKNYGEFKKAVADTVCERIAEIQKNYNAIILNGSLETILQAGASKVNRIVKNKWIAIRENVGLKI